MIDLPSLLSPAQLDAATRVDVPVCILAGAGSGKTRVITHRIAYLIEYLRAQPDSILAVTFTNKAAEEMRGRVDKLVPGRGRAVHVGTFHGMAARLLRKFGRGVGVPPGFVIYDDDDATRLLQRVVVNEMNLSKDLVRPIHWAIDAWQSAGQLPDQVPAFQDQLTERGTAAYRTYLERLAGMGALDFGSLLLKLRELLRSKAGDEVKERVRHVLVDEYQDTNEVQAEIVLALAKGAETVAVVGDDDQAIYGWRGASAENLRRFLDATPGAVLVKLEENYRSTARILEAANGIISRNETRLGKVLRPTGEPGAPVRIVRARDDLDEARRVVRAIEDHARVRGDLREVAILYRTNAISRPFEDELRRAGLPYRIVGGVRFYDRKEVKDVLATLRAALNPKSDVDALRFIGAVPRGIGATTIEKIEAAARRRGISLLEAMSDEAILDDADLSQRHVKKALEVAEKMKALGARIAPREGHVAATAKDAIVFAVEVSGVADRLSAEGTIEAQGRLEDLQELVSAAAEHGEQAQLAGQNDDVIAFLEAAALLGSNEPPKDDARGQVTLMSLHAAKGLEFDLVFLVALEEHGFPHSRALAEDADSDELEEERRLAYVGITRAKKRLVLTHAEWRMVQGTKKRRSPSRFLDEIPRGVVEGNLARPQRPELAFTPGLLGGPREPLFPNSAAHVEYEPEFTPREPRTAPRTHLIDDEREPAPGGLGTGARVSHKVFGAGRVVGVRGAGTMVAALVRFDGERQPRVIVARHLTVLDDPEAPPDMSVARFVPDDSV